MMALFFRLFMSEAAASDNFLSVRRIFAPASYSHGEIESYSIGYGIKAPQIVYIASIKYTKNAHLGGLNQSLPHAIGPSIRFQVHLIDYPKIKLYASEEIALLINIGSGSIPFVIEQNLGIGINCRVYHDSSSTINISPEIGVIPLMWAPYFSLDAAVEF